MANVIEIVIKAQDQHSAVLKSAEAKVRDFDRTVSSALPGLIALSAAIGAVGAAAFSLVQGVADSVEQLDNLASATGQGTRELQVYQQQLRLAGLSAEQLPAALRFLQVALDTNAEKLAAYGITARRDVTEALKQLGVALSNARDPAQRAAIIAETLGARNVTLAANLIGTANAMDKLVRAGEKDGSILSERSLGKMREADRALDSVSVSMDAIKNNAVIAFGPLITALARVVDLSAKAVVNLSNLRPAAARRIDAEHQRALNELLTGFGGFGGGSSGGRGGGADWGDPVRPTPTGAAAFRPNFTFLPDPGAGIRQPGAIGSAGVFNRLAEAFKEVEVPALKLTEAGQKVSRALDEAQRVMADFNASLTSNWSRTLANVTQIQTQTNNVVVQLLVDLSNAIIQTITNAIARAAGSAVTDFLGTALAFALAPATGGTSLVGAIPGATGIGPRGGAAGFSAGNTFVIQTFDARSTLEQLVSPSGSIRRANDRVGELKRAFA